MIGSRDGSVVNCEVCYKLVSVKNKEKVKIINLAGNPYDVPCDQSADRKNRKRISVNNLNVLKLGAYKRYSY